MIKTFMRGIIDLNPEMGLEFHRWIASFDWALFVFADVWEENRNTQRKPRYGRAM